MGVRPYILGVNRSTVKGVMRRGREEERAMVLLGGGEALMVSVRDVYVCKNRCTYT